MDKLELDARVARLERRVGLLLTVLVIGAVGGGLLGLFVLRGGLEKPLPAMTTFAAPLPPPAPTPPVMKPATPPGAFIEGFMGTYDEGAMGALHQELLTLKELHDEGIISESEWLAKKDQVLAEPLTPGDLRSDLELVRQLVDSQAICESERDALRAKLLEIEPQ